MKKMRNFYLLSLLLLTVFPIFSEDREQIDLEKARTLALANSRSLARYNLAIESSLLDEKAQNFAYLPSLSLSGSASMKLWNTDGPAHLDTLNAGAALGVTETVTLYDGGKNKVLKAINALSTETARKDASAEYYAVLDAVDSAYYAALEAQASLDAAAASLESADLSLSISQIRYESKMISYGDYLRALSEKASAETAKKQTERVLAVNTAKLKNLIGLSETPLLSSVDFGAYEPFIPRYAALDEQGFDTMYAELRELVRKNNTTLAKAEISRIKAEKNADLAKRDYLPSISASLSTGLDYGYQYGANSGIAPFTGSLSIKASIPLDFWVTKNKVEKQRIAQEQNSLSYRDTVDSVETEIQTAFLDLIIQAGTVVSSRRADEYSQKHFEYIQELYRLSQKSASDFYEAANQANSNRNKRVSAEYGFLLAISKIRSLCAFDNEESLIAFLSR